LSQADFSAKATSWFESMTATIEQKYRPPLVKLIKARYTTLAVFIGMLILAVGFVMGPYVKTVFFSNMSYDFIMAQLEMVDDTSPAQVAKLVE